MKNIVVIGGGAAGMMAAIKASSGAHVILLEKNEKLGKKLFITGKGRCNLTNDSDSETFLKNVVTNSKFLYSAISAYDSSDTMKDFSSMGLKMKTERGNRVFPISDHSSDVISALERTLREKKVDIKLNTRATGLKIEDNTVKGVYVGKDLYEADTVIIATGGVSYPLTGSTGDGYDFSRKAGHTIVEPKPSLVPVVIKEDWCKELMGLSLKNIEVQFVAKKNPEIKLKKDKIIYKDFGEMIFTHFGVSGPVILSASSYLHKYLDMKADIMLVIDLKPALSKEALDDRIRRDFEKYINKQYQNSLSDLLPRKLIPVIIELSGIDPFKKVNEISREERLRLVDTLKELKLTVTGLRGLEEAIITTGGVSVKEIDPKTMESKLIKGLRFAGEVIDTDALTGGFNLQIAWSTAFLSGTTIY